MIRQTRPVAHTSIAVPLLRPEGLSGGHHSGAERFTRGESARTFAFTSLWVAGFLGGGYLLLWKPLLDRWLF